MVSCHGPNYFFAESELLIEKTALPHSQSHDALSRPQNIDLIIQARSLDSATNAF